MAVIDKKSDKAERVVERLKACRGLLIVMQDYPDPDAIAAAAGLRELARHVSTHDVVTSLVCGGAVGRAENRALVKYLNLNVLPFGRIRMDQFDCVAMVDTQPGTGNNPLPGDVVPDIVVDHHPFRSSTRRSPVFDVRGRYGATSTIIHEYLCRYKVDLPVPVVTALLYGIRSDTNDLGREATQADIDTFLALYPRANKRMLGRIGMARVPRSYFTVIHRVLEHAFSYGQCVIGLLGEIDNPDMVAEMADLLLRDEETSWALCAGVHGDRILLSLRTSEQQSQAGKLMNRVVGRRGTGGGHSTMAGGQIPVSDTDRKKDLEQLLEAPIKRLRRALGVLQEPRRPLMSE